MAEDRTASRTAVLALAGLLVVVAFAGGCAKAKKETPETTTRSAGTDSPEETGSASPASEAVTPPGSTQPTKGAEPAVAAPKGETGRNLAEVKKVWSSGGKWYVKVDYLQWLVGAAANKEAAKRGMETPVPNDYLVLNDNPKLRTFEVSPSVKCVLALPGPKTTASTFAKFRATLGDYDMYWFTVKDGVVTKIEEQWVP